METYHLQVGLERAFGRCAGEFLLALKTARPDEKERIVRSLLRRFCGAKPALPGVKLILRGTNYRDAPSPDGDIALPAGIKIIERSGAFQG